MIQFDNLSQEAPYLVFKDKYNKSLKANQKAIEVICISSYSSKKKEVNGRYVNLKFINGKKFIFFSNYKSPKAQEFTQHNQITASLYWSKTNTQIRMKAYIEQTSSEFNKNYFAQRDKKKNALAISSHQSSPIASYEALQKNYELSLVESNLTECPEYWGGYSFTPYYFEFWEGHESRLNKRETYELNNGKWIHGFLQA
tara:strand:- start:5795 stop:6391 length:597 start_codon:yes stop_codon:yes gene_type:complete